MVTAASAGPLVIRGSTVMVPATDPSVWPEQALTQRASVSAIKLAVRATGLPFTRDPTCHRAIKCSSWIGSTIGWCLHHTREPEARQGSGRARARKNAGAGLPAAVLGGA